MSNACVIFSKTKRVTTAKRKRDTIPRISRPLRFKYRKSPGDLPVGISYYRTGGDLLVGTLLEDLLHKYDDVDVPPMAQGVYDEELLHTFSHSGSDEGLHPRILSLVSLIAACSSFLGCGIIRAIARIHPWPDAWRASIISVWYAILRDLLSRLRTSESQESLQVRLSIRE